MFGDVLIQYRDSGKYGFISVNNYKKAFNIEKGFDALGMSIHNDNKTFIQLVQPYFSRYYNHACTDWEDAMMYFSCNNNIFHLPTIKEWEEFIDNGNISKFNELVAQFRMCSPCNYVKEMVDGAFCWTSDCYNEKWAYFIKTSNKKILCTSKKLDYYVRGFLTI